MTAKRIVRRGPRIGGWHVLDGTGLYPETILNLHHGGYDAAWIVENYAHVPVTAEDVAAVVRWGNRPDRRLLRWLRWRYRRPLARLATWVYVRWGWDE